MQFAAPKVGKADFAEEYMRRLGNATFRWVHGLDVVPTLPPSLGAEPFVQLPAEQTLWRTLGGQCVKAAGPLLLDCPPGGGGVAAAMIAAASVDAAGSSDGVESAAAAAMAAAEAAQLEGGGRKRGRKGDANLEAGAPAGGGRCRYVIADHRLYRAVEALARCAEADAAHRGDACAARAARAAVPDNVLLAAAAAGVRASPRG